jgi:CubicO group peptidase (beta-lactamase class C family)
MLFPRRSISNENAAVVQAPGEVRELIAAERQAILTTMTKEDIPGAAVCFVHDGKLAWLEGFGVTDKQSKRAIAPNTIFSIQSVSKNITATAIMLAVQRGLLDLDKPITAYLPDFSVNSRFESNPERSITLRCLLSHRAGFTGEAPVGNYYDDAFADFDSHVRSASKSWLRCPVNDRYRYSNIGFDLAGYVLQSVSKQSLARCFETMIFDPLGMKDSTADADVYVHRLDRAVGHEAGYESVPLRTSGIGAGGVYASARDMAAYLSFHLNKGRNGNDALLDERHWNEMHSFAFPGSYSLGVAGGVLRFGETDVRMMMHSGRGFGFGCMLRFYPQANLGWAVLFNRPAGPAYQWVSGLGDEVLSRRYGKRTQKTSLEKLPSMKLPPEALQKFVGNYRERSSTRDFKLAGGALVMQRGSDQVPVQIVAPDEVALPPERPGGDAVLLRYFPPNNGATAHFEPLATDIHMDYNDGPHDPPGKDKPEWAAYVGDYSMDQWGKPLYPIKVHRKNGYLYIDTARLVVEHEQGLFFTSDGEAVDFRSGPPTWGNIRLRKVRLPKT